MPKAIPTKLLVTMDYQEANKARRVFGLGDEWMVVGMGNALVGHRFDLIAIMPGIDLTRQEAVDYLNINVRNRLNLGGEVVMFW